MASKLRIGISTCPNDTFAFHGLLTGRVGSAQLELDFELLDVQELNEGLFAGRFDVAKASFHAALLLSDRYGVFRSGSALGFGVGPLLLSAHHNRKPRTGSDRAGESPQRVLCPGEHTTAHLLYRLFYPDCGQIEQVLFSEIMPQLRRGRADFGVCIHEGRFTWQEQGLARVEDLGTRWEQETEQPLPLGGILGRLDLPAPLLSEAQRVIAESIAYGLEHRQETLETMRRYAQEFSDEVLFSHVDLYVNQWTEDLGDEGVAALQHLYRRAVAAGVVPADQPPLRLLPPAAA
jgi:1,4-dihydroxy-6-naphthoate synthase